MMAMPADGVRVRLMSDVRTCSTRERLTPRDKEQSQRRQSVHLGARNPAGGATGLDLGKMGTPVAFARRAAAAAGAVVGLQRRGARSGAHLVMSQHSRPAQPKQPLQPARGRPGRAPRVGRPALGPPMVAAPTCARNYSARAPRPAASRCGSVAIAMRKATPASPAAGDGESLADALVQLALSCKAVSWTAPPRSCRRPRRARAQGGPRGR
jgi:hypothetical protein